MAAVLGISAHYHDAAAALVVDGQLVAAIQQERLSRVKNDPALPFEAARACLAQAGIEAAALDAIAYYERPFEKLERVLTSLLRNFPRSWRQFPRALSAQLGSKLWVVDHLAEGLGVERKRVQCVDHHRSHAAASAWVSPYESCAVLVLDGVGEQVSTSTWRAGPSGLEALESIDYPHSLGLLYAGLTSWLGFRVNEGEYKVMGLAAWGEAGRGGLRERFDRLITLHADGSYELSLDHFAHFTDTRWGFGPRLETLLGPRRSAGRAWDLDDPADRYYADVAATLQVVLEEALLGLCARLRRQLPECPNLCLGGGVALNSVANARLLRESGFERVFVQPAAGDAGGALGAAIEVSMQLGDARPSALTSAALGQPISAGRAQALAESLGLPHRRVSQPAEEVAALLSQGKLVAHACGRFEWGPRALGNRSLLADPCDRRTRDRINRVVKQREDFRPFAPAVLDAALCDYFEGETNDMTPFMTTVLPVREPAREQLGAVIHEDGSARVQSVSDQAESALGPILEARRARGDIPVVLNTSLNGPGEPIVANAEDALAFFLRHKVDVLMVEDLQIERAP